MDNKTPDLLKKLNPNRIIIPILIGVAAFIYLSFSGDEKINADLLLENVQKASMLWLGLCLVMLVIRDAGYVYRIRMMTNYELSWKSSIYTIILWEFSSAITPSVVGGTAIAVFILNQEGVKFGRSLAFVMTTAVFDNLFFFIASITALVLMPDQIFATMGESSLLGFGFYFSIGLIAFYSFLLLYGLVISPKRFKWLLDILTQWLMRMETVIQGWRFTPKFFKRRGLMRRVRSGSMQIADDVIIASDVLKDNHAWFWIKAALVTLVIWTARYFMLNCLMAAFLSNLSPMDVLDHFQVLAKQVVMWVIMLASPTPGSAGTAELAFGSFFGPYLDSFGLTIVVAGAWRLTTYYFYLIVGALTLGRWLRKVIKTKEDALAQEEKDNKEKE